MGLISFLAIGLIAGWLAGQIMKGKGFGLLGNIVVGVVARGNVRMLDIVMGNEIGRLAVEIGLGQAIKATEVRTLGNAALQAALHSKPDRDATVEIYAGGPPPSP